MNNLDWTIFFNVIIVITLQLPLIRHIAIAKTITKVASNTKSAIAQHDIKAYTSESHGARGQLPGSILYLGSFEAICNHLLTAELEAGQWREQSWMEPTVVLLPNFNENYSRPHLHTRWVLKRVCLHLFLSIARLCSLSLLIVFKVFFKYSGSVSMLFFIWFIFLILLDFFFTFSASPNPFFI